MRRGASIEGYDEMGAPARDAVSSGHEDCGELLALGGRRRCRHAGRGEMRALVVGAARCEHGGCDEVRGAVR